MYDENDEEHFLEKLVELGIAELNGMTKDGEVTYNFDMIRMKELMPELYEVMIEETEQALVDLYEKGIVDIEYDENLEPYFSIPEEARDALRNIGFIPKEDGSNAE
jgi:hypothetical protein